MLRCPYCFWDEFTTLYDNGYEVGGLCHRCYQEFETQRDYEPYYSESYMEIKSISYKRTHSLGNYNSESLEMFAELDYDEDPFEAAHNLKDKVEIALGLKQTEVLAVEPDAIAEDLDDAAF